MIAVVSVCTMPNRKTYKEKTYNVCLLCDHRGVRCNGPRTSDMTLERWREFMRDMKEAEGLTYAEISERTEPRIPARTIERKLAPNGDGQDIMREVARAIEGAILGSTPYPCLLSVMGADALKSAAAQETEIAKLREALETLKAESQRKIDYLMKENERKDRIIDRLLDK